jgi:hypothetical protein
MNVQTDTPAICDNPECSNEATRGKYCSDKCRYRANWLKREYQYGNCGLCGCEVSNYGRKPPKHCKDCADKLDDMKMAELALLDEFEDDDSDMPLLTNNCSNCKFGKVNFQADRGFECGKSVFRDCKAYLIEKPLFWEEK